MMRGFLFYRSFGNISVQSGINPKTCGAIKIRHKSGMKSSGLLFYRSFRISGLILKVVELKKLGINIG
jgi:hypothetical protein